MSKKVNEVAGHEATVTVSRTMFGQDDDEARHIQIRPFATAPAKVTVRLGRTLNTGNYSSARVDVAVEMPCYREEISSVYPRLFEQVADLLSEEVDKIAMQTGVLASRGSEARIDEIL